MSRFLKKCYTSLEAYVPGEQPKDCEYIKLNTNESPFPPSPAVIKAINSDEVKNLRLYSDPTASSLKGKIAKLYSVESENIYVANGSDDILNFSFMIFSGEDKKAVFPEISYGFYKVFAQLYGIDAEMIPLKEDFSIDYRDYLNKNKFIVIANPNAPTGLTLSVSEIEEILKTNKDSVVLIDEAYIDFGGESVVPLTRKYDNLLVSMTFSKSRCMAGARLGFAIGNKELIKDLELIKYSTNPYNINRLTLVAGENAIDENDYYVDKCNEIIKNRDYTVNELKKLGFNLTDSKANFVFAQCDWIDGEALYKRLKEKGILIRHFTNEKIKNYNRITIGTLYDMKALISAIKKIKEEAK
ncbi:MAG: histidinol-phosphate transaminase [Acutalibacteraceae bacterium]|nr:histidinol-phosphate transaminase [Acutalibacteraceae bacterium]